MLVLVTVLLFDLVNDLVSLILSSLFPFLLMYVTTLPSGVLNLQKAAVAAAAALRILVRGRRLPDQPAASL